MEFEKNCKSDSGIYKKIILAGNPNVGKSTLFNAMTGLKQHTGNWSGKTVDTATGTFVFNNKKYEITDIPGCYSLTASSEEEACAAKAVTTFGADVIVVVCNAFNLERNLNLVLQILEVTNNVMVALNFCDEAKKQGVKINTQTLSKKLSVPVVEINARKKAGISSLMNVIENSSLGNGFCVSYGSDIEYELHKICKELKKTTFSTYGRFMALRLIENNKLFSDYLEKELRHKTSVKNKIQKLCKDAEENYVRKKHSSMHLEELTSYNITRASQKITSLVITEEENCYSSAPDRIFTGKILGFAIMFLMLYTVVLITVKIANYPSELLSDLLFGFENNIYKVLRYIKIPVTICDAVVYGGYRVLAWVVSVMLPPMAIFFPLFTILEDVGYLPRIAFNLDKCFKKCGTCGKQALTMCMGLGCNAVGVTGARIIDSPRERMIAILTNSFIPCNGKFPALICLSIIFFSNCSNGVLSSLYVALYIVIALLVTLLASKILSKYLLRGIPSSFSIELPMFRKPQIGQIVVSSLFNRTFLILMRAVRVAFPVGIIIWILTNATFGGNSIVNYIVNILDPIGRIMGVDGVVLTAFLLGLPANEIILPITLMLYSSQTMMTTPGGYAEIMDILTKHGWSLTTAVCVIVFFLMHWPCSTTLLTIKKETNNLKWTAFAFAMPTFFGVVSCIIINLMLNIIL